MKVLPFNSTTIKVLSATYPTPYHIYDEAAITETAQNLNRAFDWVADFMNYYAVKALPNPEILRILMAAGMGADCSSMAELVLAEKVGFKGQQIMFSSNDTPAAEFVKANQLGAIINLDDISHIDYLLAAIGHLPEMICFRFNPGAERTGNVIIGNPAEAKYGLTRDQLFTAYQICVDKGVSRFGLHTMLASNELEPSYFIETARMMFELALELKATLAIDLEFINLGGGFGIPYLPDQAVLDLPKITDSIRNLYETMFKGLLSPKIFLECGRYVTGPHGYLVSTVLHLKHTYRDYVGLDASMANLMRPAMYGAYHHITVLDKEAAPLTHVYDVTGLLCENNDKFAIQRMLPRIEVGDIVVIHDTGAHGHSMGFNYNGTLRSAELLLQKSGTTKLIRRAETLDDYFRTLSWA